MWLLNRVVFSFLFIYFVIAEDVGDDCVPNNEVSKGICTLMTECIEAVRSIRNKNFHQFRRCGFSGDQEVVCCPLSTNKFGPTEKPTTTEKPKTSQRIADRECQKIISSSTPPLAPFIVGGELASVGEFPHMVAMGFDRGNGYEFDCGGSLLSNTYVLTAAHCIETLDRIAPSIVRAGVLNLGANTFNDETDVRIDQIITYPDYSRREKYHDLALIRLAKPVEFSSDINAVCLYTGGEDLNMPLTITGWGQTNVTTERRSQALLKANVSAVSREVCGKSYNNYRKLPEGISKNQLCAGDPEGLQDTCQGDSGGPLQGLTASDGRYRLIGVTSFGRGCGSPVPGVYTRISQYLDWIESVVWPN